MVFDMIFSAIKLSITLKVGW